MKVYYIRIEGKPLLNNNESKILGGAYINCWVNTKDETTAIVKATDYIFEQGWQVLNIEEVFTSNRDMYLDEPDSLECFDQAIDFGIGAIFYTWPIGCEDDYQ